MFVCLIPLALVAVASADMSPPDHCLGFDGQPVGLNQKVETSGYEYTCQVEGEDAYLVSTGCMYQGRRYGPGMDIKNPFYAYSCVKLDDGGVELEITACKELDGSVVNAGDKVERGDFMYQCAQDDNGYLVLLPSGCINEGTEMPMDKEFDGESFWYKCMTSPEGSPMKNLAGCLSPKGDRLNAGERYFKNGFVVQCVCTERKCTHQVVGCEEEVGKERPVGSTWLQGTEPFRYLVSCKPCSTGTTITRSLTQCRYTASRKDTMLDPGCMKKVGGKLVACGVNAKQGLQIITKAASGRAKLRDMGFRDC